MNIADTFRAATRPVVTIIFAAVIAQVVTQGIDAPEWFLGMAGVVILEWWGERTVRHIKEKKGGAFSTRSNQQTAVSHQIDTES